MAIISVSTLGGLNTALASTAVAGDIIECATGTYGSGGSAVFAPSRSLASAITIRPAAGATVKFTASTVAPLEMRATKLIVQNIELHKTGVGGDCIECGSSGELLVEDCVIHGINLNTSGQYADFNSYIASGSYNNVTHGIGCYDPGDIGMNKLEVKRCKIYDVFEGIVCYLTGSGGTLVEDTEIYFTYSDTMKYIVYDAALADAVPKVFKRNFGHSTIGYPLDVVDPHVDFLQFVSFTYASGKTNNNLDMGGLVFEQNTVIENPATRGRGVQGLVSFSDGGNLMRTKNPIVRNNLFVVTSNNNISFPKISGGLFENNLSVFPDSTWEEPVGASKASVNIGGTGSAGTVTLTNNIWDELNLGSGVTFVQTGNLVTGDQGATIPYLSIFDGPLRPNTFAQVKAAWKQKGAAVGKGPDLTQFGTVGIPLSWNGGGGSAFPLVTSNTLAVSITVP